MLSTRKPYPSDLNNKEWALLAPFMPDAASEGRPREYDYREILNGIYYVLRTGCSWRMLPHDLPDWQSVYHYFRKWRKDGTWERMNLDLNEQLRQKLGKEASPSVGILDSQSVKTTEKGGSVGMTQANRSKAAKGTSW
jgi:putative transposase